MIMAEYRREKPTFRLAFGSCFKHRTLEVPGSTDIFRSIKDLKPDAFLWLGDFAYLDTRLYINKFVPNTLEVIKERFDESYNEKCKGKLFTIFVKITRSSEKREWIFTEFGMTTILGSMTEGNITQSRTK
jgi:hypothetical protein